MPSLPRCRACGSTALRRAQIRVHDLPAFVVLHYPTRCLACGHRQLRGFLTAFLARPTSTGKQY